MKKLLSITLTTLLVLFASQAFGQENIAVEADVRQAIVTNSGNISFGVVETGSVAEVAANSEDDTESANATNPTPGFFEVTSDPSSSYSIRVTQSAILSNDTETLNFTHRFLENGTSTNVTDDVDGSGYSVASGNTKLDIGGSLPSTSNTGVYNTQKAGGQKLVVEVIYN